MSIAVVITCYNEGAYIQHAVRSVLEQTSAAEVDKVVITDDGSTQSTLDVLLTLPDLDRRIELVLGHGNGLARSRNLAVSKTNSEYVAILDGDDFWTPNKLTRQLSLMRSDKAIGLVYSGFATFEDSAPEKKVMVSVRDLRDANDPTLDYFVHDAPIIPSSILMRRLAYDAVGGFNESIPVFEDTEFYLRLSRWCRLAAISETLLYKRVHSGAMTAKRDELMKHHAYVALQFAKEEPRIIPYVGKRLSERARKLGNMEAKDGRVEKAIEFYRLSLSFNQLNIAALASKLFLQSGGRRESTVLAAQRLARAFSGFARG
jgi:glycosyltransferase involved in cell wall biosynthesis